MLNVTGPDIHGIKNKGGGANNRFSVGFLNCRYNIVYNKNK